MNPRQRRGILLITVAVLGAVGVFVAVSNYVSDVRTQLGPTVAVVVSVADLPPLATPNEASLDTVEVPERWLPPNAIRGVEQISGRVAATTIPANTILSEGMFIDRPELDPGEREIAILVDAETGVGGKIVSGSVVDVFATFGGGAEDVDGLAALPSSRIVLQRAEVIEVGSPVDVPEDGVGPGSVGFGSGQRLPVTFRLSIEDANRLVYVESFATSLRLALRSPLDRDLLEDGDSGLIFDDLGNLGRLFDPVLGPGESAPTAPTAPPTDPDDAEGEPAPDPDDADPDDAEGDDAEGDDAEGDDAEDDE